MPAVHCPICFSHLPVDKFVVFPCGHGLCIDCKRRMFQESRRPKCPNCRIHIHDRDAHPVFLELIDSKVAFASSLVDGLDRMDCETPLLSVKKAGQKLGRVLQGPQLEPDAMAGLVKALEHFNERIIPLYNKREIQSHQIVTLTAACLQSRQENEFLQDQLTKANQFQKKSIQLEMELEEAKKNEDKAICLAENAKNELGRVHENLIQWKGRTEELTTENKRYKDLLESNRREKQKRLHHKQMVEQTQKSATREREAMSDATQDYDGDFSAHEHSMMRSSLNVMSTPSSRTARHLQDENHIDLDMEGMPPLRFHSGWQLNKPKLKYGTVARRPFPLDLDHKGRPNRPVQLGPRSVIHAAQQSYCP
ncbi:hypothetical protein BYT27DRAFT_7167162 [Phlegmacium glaucopus]|nr:hypothetical protein BYT27DRAFT_7167162 [Phlegmacium glaucopus]